MAALIVSLDEFAELVGVTAETMRVHLRELLKAEEPDWLVERGERGRAYKIEADGGVAWWQAKREADDVADRQRRQDLAQMRLELVGDAAGAADTLALSAKQRKEEFLAAEAGIKYRKLLGQLLDRAEVERVISTAAVELRRRLQQLPAEYGIAEGLAADQVRSLEDRLERAVNQFVGEIEDSNAYSA
jgi:hypothetical protein